MQPPRPCSWVVNRFVLGSILLAAPALGTGCKDAAFATTYGPGFQRAGRTVTVFGVYKDGRVNVEAWSDLAPRLSPALGGAPCESLHESAVVTADPTVADAVDDHARADGITDGLLDVFAPAVQSDAILVVSMAGRLPTSRGIVTTTPPQASAPNRRGLGARGAGTAGGGLTPVETGGANGYYASTDGLEVSARLFSVREHRTVAVVTMNYTGKNGDEAIASFVERLRAELPGMKCQPWSREVRVAGDRVREVRSSE